MDKPRDAVPPAIRTASGFGHLSPELRLPEPRVTDEAEKLAASRMEDEGGPPLPDEGRRTRTSTQRFQRSQQRRPSLRRAMGTLVASDVMSRTVRSVKPDSSIKDVAIVMAGDATGLVPVVDSSEKLVGLITDRDIVMRACKGDKSIDDLRAADAMTRDPTGIAADQGLPDVVSAMARLQVQGLPVVDDDFKLVGMISLGDIATRGDAGVDLRAALAALSNRKLFWTRAWR